MKRLREIVKIDEAKCNGCGLCVPACAEGAIQIIEGKARLVNEQYCDGLGACLGQCPQGAITIERHEAEEFDPEAVKRHVGDTAETAVSQDAMARAQSQALPCGCPGTGSQMLKVAYATAPATEDGEVMPSRLGNWPVQLSLVTTQAPYFQGTRLVIAADCVPFAFADFHRRFLGGRTLLIGCPKLDDANFYEHKLADILAANDIQAVEVVHMEVPCCLGLVRLVEMALQRCGKDIPLTTTEIGIRGNVQESRREQAKQPV